MTWDRSECLALAQHKCALCAGLGFDFGRAAHGIAPCPCVLRRIWTICAGRFRAIEGYERMPRATRDPGSGSMWSVRDAEYTADFCAIAKRALGAASPGYRVFRLHFLEGREWRSCVAPLGLNRGRFWHEVYRIQQKLGKAFFECRPYPLFPLDAYFSPRPRGAALRKAA